MLRGTIDEFPLIDVLGILQARNKTGRLEIERQAGRGLIYVRLGEPYYAESSLTRGLIGQKLVDIGAISDMQLRKALDRQVESGERLGQILLTNGVISGEHIATAVISQIKDALADLLAWEAGEFRWEAGAEVEVEVPLFGATIGSIDEGGNPLAPHVVPVTSGEPQDAEVAQANEPGAVSTQPDFPQGGTTMGDAVTAMQHETSPEAGQHPNLEVVDFPSGDAQDTHDEANDDGFPLEASDEPAVDEGHEEVTSENSESDDAPLAEEAADPVEVVDEFEAQPESEPEPVDEFEAQPESEPEPVDEFEAQPESEPEPVDEFEAQPEPVDLVEEFAEPEQDDHAPPLPEPLAETELPPITIDPPHDEQQPAASDTAPFHVPRVIKSQPAPELDEEFERMFKATEAPPYGDEPAAEAAAPEPEVEVDPVFRAEDFTPVAPDVDHGYERPQFELADVDPDPLFNPAHFEPVEEAHEPVPDDDEPVEEAHEPVPDADEQDDEAPEEAFEPTDFQPVTEAPEVPATESMPAEVPPTPPSHESAPTPPQGPEAPVGDASQEEGDAPDAEAAPAEALKDIKLDRSSLVRELSDLLR